MKYRFISLLFFFFLLFPAFSQAQILRKPTKKQLIQKVDSLLELTDSLQKVLSVAKLPAADSLFLEEEINEGVFDTIEGIADLEQDSLSTEQRLSLYYHQN